MKIQGYTNNSVNPANLNNKKIDRKANNEKREFSKIIKIKDPSTRGVSAQNKVKKAIVENFAEYYMKVGKTYESERKYKQAIAAYEISNSVEPDINKGKMLNSARHKEYKA